MKWLDTGTNESLLQAQERQGLNVFCSEEIAYILGLIGKEQLEKLIDPMKKD